LLQELLEDVTGSVQCQQVASQLVELHMNNESLQQCVDDLKHIVNERPVSFTDNSGVDQSVCAKEVIPVDYLWFLSIH